MLKRDYLVKQFEDFGKVLGILLGLKRDKNFDELNIVINSTALKYTQIEISFVETLDNTNLIDVLTQHKKLTDEQLKMLGDLLFEKADYYTKTMSNSDVEATNCFAKTKMIYTFLQTHSTLNFSLDMHYKLEVLDKLGFK